jgi:hypothetical protein
MKSLNDEIETRLAIHAILIRTLNDKYMVSEKMRVPLNEPLKYVSDALGIRVNNDLARAVIGAMRSLGARRVEVQGKHYWKGVAVKLV